MLIVNDHYTRMDIFPSDREKEEIRMNQIIQRNITGAKFKEITKHCLGRPDNVTLLGQTRQCYIAWADKTMLHCLGRQDNVALFGQTRQCSIVWADQTMLHCLGRPDNVTLLGQTRQCYIVWADKTM